MAASRVVVGLGDSTTAGTPGFLSPLEAPPSGRGNVESQYAFWMMKLHPEWLVLNRGVNGQRSDEILARFKRDVVAEHPDAVIVLAGVNDIFQGRSAESVERNLDTIYQRALALGTVIVTATILPYDMAGEAEVESMREVNSWIADRARERGLLFCDTRGAVSRQDEPDLLASTPDGLHPDVQGYRKMGEGLAAVLADALR